jgi:thermitase
MHKHVPRLSCKSRAAAPALTSNILTFIAALVIAFGATAAKTAFAAGAGANAPPPFAAGRILVAQQAGSADSTFEQALAVAGGHSLGRINGLNVHIVQVAGGTEQAAIARLAHSPHARFAELDRLVAPSATVNDPDFASEWHLTTIHAPTAWDTATGSGVTIAVLDSGIDSTHPDLYPQIVPGWNFYDNNSNTADINGHGTAVAGAAAAASNNGIGVASVAYGARIMPLRITDPTGYAYFSTMAQALTWAADHGARVANLSYGGASGSSTVQSAASYFRSKGGVVMVAAGNSGALDNTAPTTAFMVVSATDRNDQLTSFSSYGSFIAIAAPGIDILTTGSGGIYQYWWGTSLASPIVAGTAALVLALRPDFTPAQVDSTLFASATDLGAPGRDIYFGYGRVDAAAAVQLAVGTPTPPPDTTPPTVAIASPTGGTVSGIIVVSVNASDNVGVTRVDLRINGQTLASDTTAPYQFAWDSTTVVNGTVTLTAAAYDAAGNSSVSVPVSLNVSNSPPTDTTPPKVAITSPTGGTVSGTVAVAVSASDNVGVTRVDLRVNGQTVASDNVAPYQFGWDSTTVVNGTVALTAAAYDAAGNSAVSSPVSLSVSNSPAPPASDTTPPTLAITNPANGSLVSGNVTITSAASDNSGAAGITQSLYIDGALRSTATGSSLSYKWAVQKAAKGAHTILVTARDKAGNVATTQIQVTR